MFDFLNNVKPSILVSLGAVPGAILRMQISNKIYYKGNSNSLGILLANLFATFLLGFCLGIQNKFDYIDNNQPLYLMFCVGFLGSLSTFSTFIFETFSCFLKRKWINLSTILCSSLILGILLASIGYQLGNA